MSLSDIFSNVEEQNLRQKIVEELLNTEENLEAKTEMSKPMKWSALNIVQQFVKNHNLKGSGRILEQFEQISFKYMISNKRKGREEYIQALQSLNELEVEDTPAKKNGPLMG